MTSNAIVCLVGLLSGMLWVILSDRAVSAGNKNLPSLGPDPVPASAGAGSDHTVIAAYRRQEGLMEGSLAEAAAQILAKEGTTARALEAGKMLENIFRLDPGKAVRFSRFILPLLYPDNYPTQESVGDLVAVNVIASLGARPSGSKESANTPLIAELVLNVIANPERNPTTNPGTKKYPGHESMALQQSLSKAAYENPEIYARYFPDLLKSGLTELRYLPAGTSWKARQILGPLALELARKDPEVLGTYMGRDALSFLTDADAKRFLEDLPELESGKNSAAYPVAFLAEKLVSSDPQAGVDLLRTVEEPKLRSALLQELVEAGAASLLIAPDIWAGLAPSDQSEFRLASMREDWIQHGEESVGSGVPALLSQEGIPRKEIFENLQAYYLDTVMEPAQGLSLGLTMKGEDGVSEFLTGLSKDWAARDVVGMSLALADYPAGEVPDEVTLSLIREIPRDDPEAALMWAGRLQDPQARNSEIEALLRKVARKDPQRAEVLRSQYPYDISPP